MENARYPSLAPAPGEASADHADFHRWVFGPSPLLAQAETMFMTPRGNGAEGGALMATDGLYIIVVWNE